MNVPLLWAIAVLQCDTERIAQCSMTRASPEATGRHHRATTHSVSPRRPPYNNQNNDNRTCTHFAGRLDDHHNAVVLYRAHRPMEEACGFHKSH